VLERRPPNRDVSLVDDPKIAAKLRIEERELEAGC
jgi:hypothetical protein